MIDAIDCLCTRPCASTHGEGPWWPLQAHTPRNTP